MKWIKKLARHRQDNWNWDSVLANFRELGGAAENIRLDYGILGRGLFVIDPTEPIHIHVPESLLVPINEAQIVDGQLVAKQESLLGERERAFLDHYCGIWAKGAFSIH